MIIRFISKECCNGDFETLRTQRTLFPSRNEWIEKKVLEFCKIDFVNKKNKNNIRKKLLYFIISTFF